MPKLTSQDTQYNTKTVRVCVCVCHVRARANLTYSRRQHIKIKDSKFLACGILLLKTKVILLGICHRPTINGNFILLPLYQN